jgi:hypothetical protein
LAHAAHDRATELKSRGNQVLAQLQPCVDDGLDPRESADHWMDINEPPHRVDRRLAAGFTRRLSPP